MKHTIIFGMIGQWVGLLCSLTGIVLLAYYITNPGSIFISCGSVAWGIGTKLKYYAGIKAIEKERGKKVSIDDLLNKHGIIPYQREN